MERTLNHLTPSLDAARHDSASFAAREATDSQAADDAAASKPIIAAIEGTRQVFFSEEVAALALEALIAKIKSSYWRSSDMGEVAELVLGDLVSDLRPAAPAPVAHKCHPTCSERACAGVCAFHSA
jgi:hypothetical protein